MTAMSLDLPRLLAGAVVMAPMTKGSNLPYRRLCDELGATVTMGEMALAKKLQKQSRPEFARLRRHPAEKVFGVQLAGRTAEEMAWASALAVERGADLVDVNLGCPIHEITRRGLGSALLEKPRKTRRRNTRRNTSPVWHRRWMMRRWSCKRDSD